MPDSFDREAFRHEVLAGLASSPKTLPCKYFYDERGAELFVEICDLEEYYLTRTETAILERRAGEVASAVGAGCLVIELGSGEARKTEILLTALDCPIGYVPVDISSEQLEQTAERIGRIFPELVVHPIAADYSISWSPGELPEAKRRLAFFPGSTIGNFGPAEAVVFLSRLADLLGVGGALLIGADLQKDREILEQAYDDSRGVTAAFNLNLLTRINRELAGDFQIEAFKHRAVYNARAGRIEMYLESLKPQTVRVEACAFQLAAGEMICTEHSHKYTLEGFRDLATKAGLTVNRVWTDERQLFSVQLLEVTGASRDG